MPCQGNWLYGCTYALPLETMLRSQRLRRAAERDLISRTAFWVASFPTWGRRLSDDPRMKVTQDRTPSECGPPIKRSSKEKHPHDVTDKCHYALRVFAKEPRANRHINLRELRDKIQAGEPFPHHGECHRLTGLTRCR